MKNKIFDNEEYNLSIKLNQVNNDLDKYIILLKKEYGYSLSKKELSKVLKISTQTIDRRLKESTNIPKYYKTGKGSKSSYAFPIVEVAKFLTENTIEIF